MDTNKGKYQKNDLVKKHQYNINGELSPHVSAPDFYPSQWENVKQVMLIKLFRLELSWSSGGGITPSHIPPVYAIAYSSHPRVPGPSGNGSLHRSTLTCIVEVGRQVSWGQNQKEKTNKQTMKSLKNDMYEKTKPYNKYDDILVGWIDTYLSIYISWNLSIHRSIYLPA